MLTASAEEEKSKRKSFRSLDSQVLENKEISLFLRKG